jgi:hypothetical protein
LSGRYEPMKPRLHSFAQSLARHILEDDANQHPASRPT